jgi:hypothetical protein
MTKERKLSMLQAALAYTEHGISVIPSHPQTKRPLWQRLPKVNHPTKVGKKKAVWKPFQSQIANPKIIRYWFGDNYPNVSLVCGQVSGGLVVFDFDYAAAITLPAWLKGIEPALRPLFPISRSGKGYHVYLRVAGRQAATEKVAFNEEGELLIDVKAEGGLVQAPPSMHPSGCRYRWLRGNPRHIPTLTQAAYDQLLATARSFDRRPKQQPLTKAEMAAWRVIQLPRSGEGTATRLHRYVEVAVANECAHLARAFKGMRNDALNKAAFRLGRFVGAGLLTPGQVYQALRQACEANHYLQDDGLDAFRRTCRSGLVNGTKCGQTFLEKVLAQIQSQ